MFSTTDERFHGVLPVSQIPFTRDRQFNAIRYRSIEGDERLVHKTAMDVLMRRCDADRGSASCINALADDDALPPPMPPAMRNVLIWGPGSKAATWWM